MEDIKKKRNFLLSLVKNDAKELSFLQKNELIFVFHKNILKNYKKHPTESRKRYIKWFQFADKTINKENQKKDFEEYEKDKTFQDIIQILKIEDMNLTELALAEEIEKEKAIERTIIRHELEEEMRYELERVRREVEQDRRKAVEQAKKKAAEQTRKKLQEVINEKNRETANAVKAAKKRAISKMQAAGLNIELIAEFSDLSLEIVKAYIQEIEKERKNLK